MQQILNSQSLGLSAPSGKSPLQHLLSGLQGRFRHYLDRVHPFVMERWAALGLLVLLYFLRVWIGAGWYVVTYGLGIYTLNLLVLFLSPLNDPELEGAEDEDEGPSLPMAADDEHRPFVPKLPEFKFWYKMTRAVVISFVLTMTRLTDIPVFWPILLMYFVVLTFLTMKRRIQHMIKHKYIPLNFLGKKKYVGAAVPPTALKE
jgi:hypothetical protein